MWTWMFLTDNHTCTGFWHATYSYWPRLYVDFGQSRLRGLSLGAFIISTRKNWIAYRPKLVTETSLIVRQYVRLSSNSWASCSFCLTGQFSLSCSTLARTSKSLLSSPLKDSLLVIVRTGLSPGWMASHCQTNSIRALEKCKSLEKLNTYRVNFGCCNIPWFLNRHQIKM